MLENKIHEKHDASLHNCVLDFDRVMKKLDKAQYIHTYQMNESKDMIK